MGVYRPSRSFKTKNGQKLQVFTRIISKVQNLSETVSWSSTLSEKKDEDTFTLNFACFIVKEREVYD